jgi:hypothetical protein
LAVRLAVRKQKNSVNKKEFITLQKDSTMNYTEKNIIESYSMLFEGLSSLTKIELIESLTKSLKREKTFKKDDFYKSFGAFGSEKSAEEIVNEIKSSRKFRTKEIKF